MGPAMVERVQDNPHDRMKATPVRQALPAPAGDARGDAHRADFARFTVVRDPASTAAVGLPREDRAGPEAESRDRRRPQGEHRRGGRPGGHLARAVHRRRLGAVLPRAGPPLAPAGRPSRPRDHRLRRRHPPRGARRILEPHRRAHLDARPPRSSSSAAIDRAAHGRGVHRRRCWRGWPRPTSATTTRGLPPPPARTSSLVPGGTTPPRWFTDTDEGHSQWYIERFRTLADEGATSPARPGSSTRWPPPRRASSTPAAARAGSGQSFTHHGHEVVGVDADPELIAAAQQDHPGPTWIVADLSVLDLAVRARGSPFDAAVIAGQRPRLRRRGHRAAGASSASAPTSSRTGSPSSASTPIDTTWRRSTATSKAPASAWSTGSPPGTCVPGATTPTSPSASCASRRGR